MTVKVGTFAKSTNTFVPVDQAVTGVGFTPKVLWLFMAGPTADATWTSSYYLAHGVSTSSSNFYTMAAASVDAGASSNTSRLQTPSAMAVIQWGESLLAECDLKSFDGDGFTLTWATNNNVAYIINYVAFSSASLAANVVYWDQDANDTAITGVGFRPTFAQHWSPIIGSSSMPADTTSAIFCFGAMDGTREWASTLDARDGAATSNTSSGQILSECIMWNAPGVGNLHSDFKSFDADGFTVENGVALSSDRYVMSLCMAGDSFRAGYVNMDTDSGAQAVTGFGFKPAGLMFWTTNTTLDSETAGDHIKFSMGATDGTNQVCVGVKDEDGLADTDANSITYADRVIVEMDTSGQDITRYATLSSLDNDGFTLNWSGTGTANKLMYIAFGAVAVASARTRIVVC